VQKKNPLGTLCVIDSKPRKLNEQQINTLYKLANQVSKLIHLRLTNLRLKKSLEEKSTLLKEIHHRVKNNLQLVSSLLNLQKKSLDNDLFSDIISTSQSRIKSIAIVHEKLYNSKSLSSINIDGYFRDLIAEIINNISNPELFKFDLEVQNMDLNIEHILPLGLIINELVNNSVKHCNQINRITCISIQFKKEKIHTLKYNDNGPGIKEKIKDSKGIGLELIHSLVDQIDGKIESYSDENGLFYTFSF
jgi:two-component sensor histidine kinase